MYSYVLACMRAGVLVFVFVCACVCVCERECVRTFVHECVCELE